VSLAFLASVAGVSRWKRIPGASGNYLIVLSDRGHLVQLYSPTAMEADIMLCIIGTLLAIIALQHRVGVK
jgi:hypothetical protein